MAISFSSSSPRWPSILVLVRAATVGPTVDGSVVNVHPRVFFLRTQANGEAPTRIQATLIGM